MDINVTTDETLKKLPYFHKVVQLLDKLESSGLLGRMSGNCISASDIVQTMLTQSGIECEIIECQACIHRQNEHMEFFFLGYDNNSFPGEVDTHLVVVTKTEVPILIDISISHLLPLSHPYVVEKVSQYNDPLTFCEVSFDNVKISYQKKKTIKVPSLHQKSLIARIKDELLVKEKLNKAWLVIVLTLALSVINFAANTILIVLKLIWL